MAWNINFDGKTKLKDWWGVVRDNFIYLKNFITQVNDSIDTRIAEAQGINANKHIAESADDTSEWIITDRYLVPVPATDGKVVYSEYAYIDGAWVVVGSTQETDLSEVKAQLAECATIDMIERSNICRELEAVCSVNLANEENLYKNAQGEELNRVVYEEMVTVEGIGGYPRSITISTPIYLDKDNSNYYSSSYYSEDVSLEIEVSYLGKTKKYVPSISPMRDIVISLLPTEEKEMVKGKFEIGIKGTLYIKPKIHSNGILDEWAVRISAWSVSIPKTAYLVSLEKEEV